MALYARSDVLPIEPSEVKGVVAELNLGKYFHVASLALLIYDISK